MREDLDRHRQIVAPSHVLAQGGKSTLVLAFAGHSA